VPTDPPHFVREAIDRFNGRRRAFIRLRTMPIWAWIIFLVLAVEGVFILIVSTGDDFAFAAFSAAIGIAGLTFGTRSDGVHGRRRPAAH
jgi:hypothetical protein